jgi:hypothetical protein
MAIEILAAPGLRTSWTKVAVQLREADCDGLFLNFSKDLEGLVTELAEVRLSYEDFIEEAAEEKLVPEPLGAWVYTAEPILRSLGELKCRRPLLKIHCYRDVRHDRLSARVAGEIAALTLRTSITGRVDIKRWKGILMDRIECKRGVLRGEAEFIRERAAPCSICTSGLDGELLKQHLMEGGEEVYLKNVEEYYYPTPLETLEEKLAEGDPPDEEVGRLVKEHVEYVKNYILMGKNRDQAYYRWALDKVPSAKERIDPVKVEYMDVPLQNGDS